MHWVEAEVSWREISLLDEWTGIENSNHLLGDISSLF
jgi:hypothetical protein